MSSLITSHRSSTTPSQWSRARLRMSMQAPGKSARPLRKHPPPTTGAQLHRLSFQQCFRRCDFYLFDNRPDTVVPGVAPCCHPLTLLTCYVSICDTAGGRQWYVANSRVNGKLWPVDRPALDGRGPSLLSLQYLLEVGQRARIF